MNFIVKDNDEIWRKSTLAHMLDLRKVSYGEPNKGNLPETINPLELLLIAMSNHLTTIKIRQASIRQDFTHCLPFIQKMISPGKSIIIVKELEPVSDIILRSTISDSHSVGSVVSVSETFPKANISDEIHG